MIRYRCTLILTCQTVDFGEAGKGMWRQFLRYVKRDAETNLRGVLARVLTLQSPKDAVLVELVRIELTTP